MSLNRPPVPRSGLQTLTRLLLLASIALLTVACGGASANGVVSLAGASTAPSSAPAASLDPEEAMLTFAQCMREHGIDMPDPEVSGDGNVGFSFKARPGAGTQDMEDLQAAHEACEEHLPEGGPDGRPMEIDPEMEQALLDFARCMREHGIDFPDPQFESGGGMVRIGDGEGPNFDPSSDEFQEAHEACGELMPGGKGGFGFSIGGVDGDTSGPATNEDTETP